MWNQELFKRALDFAAKAHGAQTVPGSGFPYVVHVTKVASEVLRASTVEPFDVDLALACALLHDTLEDTGAQAAELEALFGVAVREGVQALTKNDALPRPERMPDSLKRLAAAPKAVALVKLADRITNLEPAPPDWSPEKRVKYLEEAKAIDAALGWASPYLSARLQEKLREYRT
jgi:(p)ppGpp synthase/HD superfamily hydrolase